jgi:hypothetical protein
MSYLRGLLPPLAVNLIRMVFDQVAACIILGPALRRFGDG